MPRTCWARPRSAMPQAGNKTDVYMFPASSCRQRSSGPLRRSWIFEPALDTNSCVVSHTNLTPVCFGLHSCRRRSSGRLQRSWTGRLVRCSKSWRTSATRSSREGGTIFSAETGKVLRRHIMWRQNPCQFCGVGRVGLLVRASVDGSVSDPFRI